MKEKKQIVLDNIGDLVSNLLYYDRKEDEDLRVGVIEDLVERGDLTIDEMVAKFREELEEAFEPGVVEPRGAVPCSSVRTVGSGGTSSRASSRSGSSASGSRGTGASSIAGAPSRAAGRSGSGKGGSSDEATVQRTRGGDWEPVRRRDRRRARARARTQDHAARGPGDEVARPDEGRGDGGHPAPLPAGGRGREARRPAAREARTRCTERGGPRRPAREARLGAS